MRQLSTVESSIVRALAYNKVFSYPLLESEIRDWMDVPVTKNELNSSIDLLLNEGLIFSEEDYLGLESQMIAAWVERRKLGNEKASEMLFAGKKYYRLISSFPFVRAVLLSGSISKNFMGDDADIDYFIITAPDRLWLTRTLLILFKKIFLLNNKRFFCVNYLITTEALLLQEKNRFTATELLTTIPVFGVDHCADLVEENAWSRDYYPNKRVSKSVEIEAPSFPRSKSFFESCFSNRLGLRLDYFCQKLTIKRWRAKFPKMNEEDFLLALKSTRTVSKHHPSNYQKKVLSDFAENLSKFQSEMHVQLNYEENSFYS